MHILYKQRKFRAVVVYLRFSNCTIIQLYSITENRIVMLILPTLQHDLHYCFRALIITKQNRPLLTHFTRSVFKRFTIFKTNLNATYIIEKTHKYLFDT